MSEKFDVILKEEMIASYLKIAMSLYMKRNSLNIAKRLIADFNSSDSVNRNHIKIDLSLSLKSESFDFIKEVISGSEDLEKIREKLTKEFKQLENLGE